ncbi:MAG TPA: RsmE family RNA methyltransferase [Erysipelotrichaceae bacterium]|nr:RsmE family RNA methyltransferase [Erysipelotrichaceae bacterium]HQB32215.1 RsmE family RNA methyltransferase [Erysipelotrichaceae bacterium]
MRQYFIDKRIDIGETVYFDEKQSHHIKNVLRMENGDIIRVVDKDNAVFLVEISIEPNVSAKVLRPIAEFSEESDIIFCAALIKKDKWEFLLQKAAELGATKIVPLITSRTNFKMAEERRDKRVERWNKITLEACQQSNRVSRCEVEKPIKLKEITRFLSENNIVAYEGEKDVFLANLIDEKSITFVIGPEGGLTEEEIEYLKLLDFRSASLGKRILRAETAGLYVLAVIDAKRNSL